MSVSRRQFLKGTSSAAVSFVGGLHLFSTTSNARTATTGLNALRIPPLLDGQIEGGVKKFDLAVQSGRTKFFKAVSTPTIGVNGSFLGPTMKFRAGDHVSLDVTNKLQTDTTVHWHGLHVPAKADGGPHQIVRPGDTWSPSFQVKQKAAMFWYHSHLLGKTGSQVNQGLAGLIYVEDDEQASLKLPSEYGVDDVPLVVQDRRFAGDGSFVYLTSMHDEMMGFKGDVVLVNGTFRPYLNIRRQRTRLRLLNGSNARIYNFGFSDRRSFIQIATDGSLLERPVRLTRLRLSPGERAEILVDMQPHSRVSLMSYPDRVGSRGMMPGMMRGMVGNNETFEVLELRSERLEKSDKALPDRLTEVPNWERAKAQRERNFSLNMPMMGMMRGRGGMMGGGMMHGRGMMGHHGMMGSLMRINGRSMDKNRIDVRVPLGSIEIWAIRNDTPLAHPFHIHDIQFRILDRNGRKPLLGEQGLKDTVLVDPGESVRVITEFADYADATTPYMYHCHILEHEDAGMMGQFVVTS